MKARYIDIKTRLLSVEELIAALRELTEAAQADAFQAGDANQIGQLAEREVELYNPSTTGVGWSLLLRRWRDNEARTHWSIEVIPDCHPEKQP